MRRGIALLLAFGVAAATPVSAQDSPSSSDAGQPSSVIHAPERGPDLSGRSDSLPVAGTELFGLQPEVAGTTGRASGPEAFDVPSLEWQTSLGAATGSLYLAEDGERLLVSADDGLHVVGPTGEVVRSFPGVFVQVTPSGIAIREAEGGVEILDIDGGSFTRYEIPYPMATDIAGGTGWFAAPYSSSDSRIGRFDLATGEVVLDLIDLGELEIKPSSAGPVVLLATPSRLLAGDASRAALFDITGPTPVLIERRIAPREGPEPTMLRGADTFSWGGAEYSMADFTPRRSLRYPIVTTNGLGFVFDRPYDYKARVVDAETGAFRHRWRFARGVVDALLLPDGKGMVFTADDLVLRYATRPAIEWSDPGFLAAATDRVTLHGSGFSELTTVTIDGAPVGWAVVDETAVQVDASALDPARPHAIVVRSDLGERSWRLASASDPPPGAEVLTVQVEGGGRSVVGLKITCPSYPASSSRFVPALRRHVDLRPGERRGIVLPPYRSCTSTLASRPDDAIVTSGPLGDDGRLFDTSRAAFDFRAGTGSIGFGHRIDTRSADATIWLAAQARGQLPRNADYVVRISCPGDRQATRTVRVEPGHPERLRVKPTVTRCTFTATRPPGSSWLFGSRVVDGVAAGGETAGRRATVTVDPGSGRRNQPIVVFAAGFDPTPYQYPIVVGSPEEDVGAAKDAGQVHLISTDAAGLVRPLAKLVHQDSGGIPGRAGAGDRFGAALAVGDFDGDGDGDVAVGAPGEGRGAGSVTVLYERRGQAGRRNQLLSQRTRGVGDAPDAGDGFGSSLAALDWNEDGYADLAVGVPGEDLPGARDAGMVQVIFGGPQGLTGRRSAAFTQDTFPATPLDVAPEEGGLEAVERGDRFGSALAGLGPTLAVASAGETSAAARQGGVVQVARPWVEYPGRNLYSNGRGDGVGAVIALFGSRLAIGSPNFDSPPWRNSGAVTIEEDEAVFQRIGEQYGWASNNRFGASVAIVNESQYLIGAPGRDDGGGDSGNIWIFSFSVPSFYELADVLLPGPLEPGDRVGAAMARPPSLEGLLVGAPGETVAGVPGAGAVSFIGYGDLGAVELDEATPWIPGEPEPGDGFGSVLAGE